MFEGFISGDLGGRSRSRAARVASRDSRKDLEGRREGESGGIMGRRLKQFYRMSAVGSRCGIRGIEKK